MRHFVLSLLATGAAAQTVNLKWSDCGDADTHAKVTGFSPDTVTIGQKTTLKVTSTLDKDITDGTFEMKLKGMGVTLMDCKGDASVSKTCNMPFGSGSMTWDAIAYPVKAGEIHTTTELLINSMSGVSSTTTITNMTTSSGDKVSCVKVVSSAADSSHKPHTPPSHQSAPDVTTGATVNLKWSDCGDADTHAKITGFSPTTVTIGQKATLTATSTLDKDITDGTFEMKLQGMGMTLMDCKGDASASKTCNMPFGSGSMTWDAIAYPMKAGSIKTTTELLINSMSGVSSTTTITNVTTSSGDKVSCVKVVSSTADSSYNLIV